MKFSLKETKIGVRVIDQLGRDYTIENNLRSHNFLWWKLCASKKWSQITEDDFNIIKKLSESCQYGRAKFLRNIK